MNPAELNVNQEPVCWANEAPNTRQRHAFKWAKGEDGQFRRVQSTNDRGEPLMERIPQGAQYGTPIGGLKPAPIQSHVRVLRHDGTIADVRVNQGAAHDPAATGDTSYQHYMLGLKGRKLGWIRVGQCPAAMALSSDERGPLLRSGAIGVGNWTAIAAPDVVNDGRPCPAEMVGRHNPPCRHFVAEQEARLARAKAQSRVDAEIFKTDEAKLLEGQQKLAAAQTEVLNTAVTTMTKAVEKLADRVDAAPAKGGK